MPYIPHEDRDYLYNKTTNCSILQSIETVGQLNYIMTIILHQYIGDSEACINYCKINDAIGVLECAKLELYRQIAAPYEDKKKKENGSISELDDENL